MSHITTCDLKIKDLGALKQAAEACGLEFVEGQKTYKWYGRRVGDDPMPPGMKEEDLGKCDHALRVPGKAGAYEIGVVANPDGTYTLLWDSWAGGKGLMQHVSSASDRRREGIGKLHQEYSAAVTRKELLRLKRRGYRVKEVREGNTIKIKAYK